MNRSMGPQGNKKKNERMPHKTSYIHTGATFPRGMEALRLISGNGMLVLSAYGGLLQFRRCLPSVRGSISRTEALAF
jgi:hypothetical protein